MFRNMEYVYCVYKERSFSKAAEKLHIAQPSLSAMIRKEEEQAGAPIFERKTRPVSLTPFGIEFIRGIEQIYELENHLHDMADELRTLQSGIVSIGGSNLSSDYIVPERIAAFKTKYPNVTLRASEASTIQCKQMLDAGDLDLVITNRPLDTESYERIVCYRENLLLAVPSHFAVNEGLRNYQLTQAERGEMIFLLPEERCAPLEYFYDTPFILLHDGNYLRLCCERMSRRTTFSPASLWRWIARWWRTTSPAMASARPSSAMYWWSTSPTTVVWSSISPAVATRCATPISAIKRADS